MQLAVFNNFTNTNLIACTFFSCRICRIRVLFYAPYIKIIKFRVDFLYLLLKIWWRPQSEKWYFLSCSVHRIVGDARWEPYTLMHQTHRDQCLFSSGSFCMNCSAITAISRYCLIDKNLDWRGGIPAPQHYAEISHLCACDLAQARGIMWLQALWCSVRLNPPTFLKLCETFNNLGVNIGNELFQELWHQWGFLSHCVGISCYYLWQCSDDGELFSPEVADLPTPSPDTATCIINHSIRWSPVTNSCTVTFSLELRALYKHWVYSTAGNWEFRRKYVWTTLAACNYCVSGH